MESIKEQFILEFNKRVKEVEESKRKDNILRKQFVDYFTEDKIKTMTLDEYAIGKSHDIHNFSYGLETVLKHLGSINGMSSEKFGVWFSPPKKKYSVARTYREYGSVNKAFEAVRKDILSIIRAGREEDFETFTTCPLNEYVKSKIFSVYYPDRYISIFKKQTLNELVDFFDLHPEGEGSIYQREALIKMRNEHPIMKNWTLQVFSVFAWDCFIKLRGEVETSYSSSNDLDKSNSQNQRTDTNTETEMTDNYQQYIDLLEENHNLVLIGAPGTGKTYMAKAIAEEMGAETEFVQFHPSYDYTDFVEGLRPIEKGEDQVGFRRMDGIFKKFCKKAILDDGTEGNGVLKKLNENPRVWKVSLYGTYDNPIRTDCLNNGYIRIGWHEYGDVEDFNEKENYEYGGRVILRAFQSEMKVGDIIVSCYSQTETDAIGIVTGDYEYRAEGGHLPRYRTVEWIIKGVRLNIEKLIGSKFTQATVYRLYVPVPKILEFIRNNGGLRNTNVSNTKPYVMIIDEINRGELSKIFGELFYAIDPGYRGERGRVKTQFQNLIDDGDVFADGFYIPENVYILATMNDIDRSVESMDFAMRRRFTWQEVTPRDTEGMLDSLSCAAEAKSTMHRLNAAITDTDGLGVAYMIGPSYFLKLGNNGGDFNKLWRMNIEPLLKEYLRGFRKMDEIMEKFHKAYFNTQEESNDDILELEDEN